MRMLETCWTVFKRQAIKPRDWCIWLVDLFEYTMMHGLTNPKFTDDSVQHLLQLKNVRHINVQIDVHFFGFVCVANITGAQNRKQSLGNKNWWHLRENFNTASANGNPSDRDYSDYRYSNTRVPKHLQSSTILSSRWSVKFHCFVKRFSGTSHGIGRLWNVRCTSCNARCWSETGRRTAAAWRI
jgi:hypothetical protein